MLLSVDDALERIASGIGSPERETVSVREAAGRILAEPLVAVSDHPPFRSSAMDGYAVRAADLEGLSELEVIGEAQAGRHFDGEVGPGQCVRIFTGAVVPAGADAVAIQENATRMGDVVSFDGVVRAGQNIRAKSNDFSQGDCLVPAGTLISPALNALIAAANHAVVQVARRPRVSLLATGNELVQPGATPGVDQIISSNSYGLAALFSRWSTDIKDWGIVGDDPVPLKSVLERGLAAAPDVLVTTGGASVGEHDFVQDALVANGVEIDFWRIAMRPGKPLMFGRKNNTLVFGLPGNPVSALVTAQIFVLPTLMRLSGLEPLPPLQLPLATDLEPNGPRRHYIRAQLISDNGATAVRPTGETDSGHLSSLASSTCLIVQHELCSGKRSSQLVDVILL